MNQFDTRGNAIVPPDLTQPEKRAWTLGFRAARQAGIVEKEPFNPFNREAEPKLHAAWHAGFDAASA